MENNIFPFEPTGRVPVINQRRSRIMCSSCHGNYNQYEYFSGPFPPGYRFRPTDEELMKEYLMKKIHNQPLPPNRIHAADLYEYGPDDLTRIYGACEENQWYFLTPRDKKYPNGSRPNRKAGNGFWKLTGKDRAIVHNNIVIGCRNSLVYYKGEAKKGGENLEKTGWLMNEYRAKNPPPPVQTSHNSMRLDDWVLSEIHWKPPVSNKPNKNEDELNEDSSSNKRKKNEDENEDSSSDKRKKNEEENGVVDNEDQVQDPPEEAPGVAHDGQDPNMCNTLSQYSPNNHVDPSMGLISYGGNYNIIPYPIFPMEASMSRVSTMEGDCLLSQIPQPPPEINHDSSISQNPGPMPMIRTSQDGEDPSAEIPGLDDELLEITGLDESERRELEFVSQFLSDI